MSIYTLYMLSAALMYLCTQDGAPGAEHHQADDPAAHDHRHQENHHHAQLKGETQEDRV